MGNCLSSLSNLAHTGRYSKVQTLGQVSWGDNRIGSCEAQGPQLTNSHSLVKKEKLKITLHLYIPYKTYFVLFHN